MKYFVMVAVLLLLGLTLNGCVFYSSPVIPPVGMLYSEVYSTQDVDFDQTALSNRKGEATVQNVLGLFSWGDCSAGTAARNGGLRQINHSDYRFFTILGVYSEYTTIVYGD